MTWKLAPALDRLRAEVDREYRLRSRKSDGTIGDASHQARPNGSDHNPNESGIVCAIDFTHDPKRFNAHKFAEALRLRCKEGKEQRVNYIISKSRIASVKTGFEWTEYEGTNPHDKHIHISVKQEPRRYNSARNWWLKNWY
jgi:hypothetical protein